MILEITTGSVHPNDVDGELIKTLQDITERSFVDAMPERAKDISRHFNPYPSGLLRTKTLVEDYANKLGLVVARSAEEVASQGKILGYLLAKNEIKANLDNRLSRRVLLPIQKYARIERLCVDPEYQRQQIGRRLVLRAMGLFRPNQIPIVDIPAENTTARDAFSMYGFGQFGWANEQPDGTAYFGASAEPVELARYVAHSVNAVRSRTNP